jgi:hypothetical protein
VNNRVMALLDAAAAGGDCVPAEEVLYRYIALCERGVEPSAAFSLAYQRALETIRAQRREEQWRLIRAVY